MFKNIYEKNGIKVIIIYSIICSVMFWVKIASAEQMVEEYLGSESDNEPIIKENPNYDKKVVATAQPGWINQSTASSSNSNENKIEITVIGLTQANIDIAEKAEIIYSLDALLGQAVYLLMSPQGGGHSAEDTATALIAAGYDKESVNSYLGSSINQSNSISNSVQNTSVMSNGDPIILPANEDSSTLPAVITVQDNRLENTDPAALQNLKDNLEKAQDYFASLGYDKVPINLTIETWGSGSVHQTFNIETGIGKDGSLGLTMYVNPDGLDSIDVSYGVLLHEYSHLVFANQMGDSDFVDTVEGAGLSEGFGAYFQSSGNDKSLLGGQIGDIDLAKNYTYTPGTTVDNGYYPRGAEINNAIISWASALWELRGSLGSEACDKLVGSSISNMDGATFIDAVQALIKSDAQLNGGANSQKILDTMQKHGFTA